MLKKPIIGLLPLFIFFFNAPSSYSEDVFLTIGDGSGDPGSKNIPITVTLDNKADRVKGLSFQICYNNKTYLSVTKCEGTGRASALSCQYNNGVGCSKIMFFGMGDDIITEGTGQILRFYYNVPTTAPPGESIVLKPVNTIVSSDIRVIQQGRSMFKSLTVAVENGSFHITGNSDDEDEDTTDGSDTPTEESMSDTSANQLSAGSNSLNFSDGTIQPTTTSSIKKTSPTTSSSGRQTSTRRTTQSTQESVARSPSGKTAQVPDSGSSGTRIIVSPETVTLTSGDMIALDPQTINGGIEVEGNYSYMLTPPSSIGSTIDDEGLFTAGTNTSPTSIEETIKVTDTAHENAIAFVVIVVAGRMQPSSTCELSISPSSATLSPDDSITFSAKNFGKTCSEGLFEWKVNSTIGSSISEQGIYKAGTNTSSDPALDIIIVTDSVNEVSTDAIVTVISTAKVGSGVSTGSTSASQVSGWQTYPKILIVLTIFTIVIGIIFFRKIRY